jgi:hypothetical protein
MPILDLGPRARQQKQQNVTVRKKITNSKNIPIKNNKQKKLSVVAPSKLLNNSGPKKYANKESDTKKELGPLPLKISRPAEPPPLTVTKNKVSDNGEENEIEIESRFVYNDYVYGGIEDYLDLGRTVAVIVPIRVTDVHDVCYLENLKYS